MEKILRENGSTLLRRLKIVASCTVLVVGFFAGAILLSGCQLQQQRYDLARPVNLQDWLMVWEDPDDVTDGAIQSPDYRIRAGEPIFGLEAPLENYLEVIVLGRGIRDDDRRNEESIEGWINRDAPAMYFLPLYDQQGQWARSLIVWREQHAVLIAHSFDEGYQQYHAAKDQLTGYLIGTYGNAYKHSEYRAYWTWLGIFVFAENSQGSYGQFFSDFGALEGWDFPYSFTDLEGKVLSEAEIIRIIETVYNFGFDDDYPPAGDFRDDD